MEQMTLGKNGAKGTQYYRYLHFVKCIHFVTFYDFHRIFVFWMEHTQLIWINANLLILWDTVTDFALFLVGFYQTIYQLHY